MAEQSGSRLPLLEPQDMTPAQREVYERFTAPRPNGTRPKGTPYRITLHWPEFTGLWFQTGETLRKQGQLPASLSELVILMAVSHWQCEHAMGTHAMAARNKGLPESIVSAVLRGQRPEGMDAAQAAIHDYCNELQISHKVSAASHDAVLRQFGPFGIVELTAVLGYYTMVAMTLNANSAAD